MTTAVTAAPRPMFRTAAASFVLAAGPRETMYLGLVGHARIVVVDLAVHFGPPHARRNRDFPGPVREQHGPAMPLDHVPLLRVQGPRCLRHGRRAVRHAVGRDTAAACESGNGSAVCKIPD